MREVGKKETERQKERNTGNMEHWIESENLKAEKRDRFTD